MRSPASFRRQSTVRPIKRSSPSTLFVLLFSIVVLTASAWAGSEQVLYQFKSQKDGFWPLSGVLLFHGKIYGATNEGGRSRYEDGTIYELTRTKSGWTKKNLHNFTGGRDGSLPITDMTADKAGNLYGSTIQGGRPLCYYGSGCGVIFKLTHGSGSWKETVVHYFDEKDGSSPMGNLVWDAAGNLYGTATGDETSSGTVFKLSPSGTNWKLATLHRFSGPDGGNPMSLFRDSEGNLYGSTGGGGTYGYGTVYELSPSGKSWTLTTLYSFTGGTDGSLPYGPVLYKNGMIYGTTLYGGAYKNFGAVYQLKYSNGAWQESVLYSFTGGTDGSYPCCGVVMDAKGNLYGTTEGDTIFKLTNSGGQWTESTAFSFNGADGSDPYSRLVWDGRGNLYGTTSYGGNYCGDGGCGTIFKFTP